MIDVLAGFWANRRLEAPLRALESRAIDFRRVGSGGTLATYVVTARKHGTGETVRYVVKRTGTKHELALRLGTTLPAMFDAEWEMTRILSDAGFGPAGLARGRNWIVREHWEGTALSELLARTGFDIDRELDQILELLQHVLTAVGRESAPRYIDFNCDNILRRPDGRYFLVDHEWSALPYRSADEMERITVVAFLCKLLPLLPPEWTVVRLFDRIAAAGFPRWAGDSVRDGVAHAFYSTADPAFLAKLHGWDELDRRLAAAQTRATPTSALQGLCERLDARGIRWSHRDGDRHLAAAGEPAAHVMLQVDPRDLTSFTDAAFALGFACYGQNRFARYCAETEQYLTIDAQVRSFGTAGGSARARPGRAVRCAFDWLVNLRRLVADGAPRGLWISGPKGAPETAALRKIGAMMGRAGVGLEIVDLANGPSAMDRERPGRVIYIPGGAAQPHATSPQIQDGWIEIRPGLPPDVLMQRLLVLCLSASAATGLSGLRPAAARRRLRPRGQAGGAPGPHQIVQVGRGNRSLRNHSGSAS